MQVCVYIGLHDHIMDTNITLRKTHSKDHNTYSCPSTIENSHNSVLGTIDHTQQNCSIGD